MNEQKARENELRGFQGAFEDSGALGTMTAFNRVGLTYASAHKGLMTTVLQDEWGFRGYAVTDMINGDKYMRADNSLLAGTTILDSGKSTWFTVDAIKKDATIQKAMKEAMHHNFYAIANSNGLNNVNSSSRIIYLMTWWKATLIALYVTFGTLTLAGAVIYVIFVLKPAKEDVKESEVK
jgi:beta-glucosidase